MLGHSAADSRSGRLGPEQRQTTSAQGITMLRRSITALSHNKVSVNFERAVMAPVGDHWRNQPYDALSGALILRNDSTAGEHHISLLELPAFVANYSQ